MRNLFTTIYFFVITGFCLLNSCSKKHEEPIVINPTVNPVPYSVLVYFITPTDKIFDPKYYKAAKLCILNLQDWYKTQMGNNKTFELNPVVIDTLSGLHNSSWYSDYHGDSISSSGPAYAFHNTKYEIKQLLGSNFDTTHYTYFVFINADFPDQTIPRGFASEGSSNLEGLSGSYPNSWIGGAGHSLGHAFGLPEVAVENPKGIMSTGFTKYPNCVFTQEEKDSLNTSPFLQVQ